MTSIPPLAERMRPDKLDDFIGQEHIIGKNSVLRKAIENKSIPSIIFWGPPGTGKTTLARIIAKSLNCEFYTLSAISSGVKEVRETIDKAKRARLIASHPPILFIDEIHRFNKSQQDSLLSSVEEGIITLIGATTENPSFEVISPLLSRCQVFILKPLNIEELKKILHRAIEKDEILKTKNIFIEEYDAILRFSGGDARKLLNILDIIINTATDNNITITNDRVQAIIQKNIALYDKSGEQHYDITSAFIKSIRGSDPNAALYWLARMYEGGEDPEFIARRLVILAAEDIGLANPNALLLATSCFEAVRLVGWPEARIILAETTIYLATSPKSNSSYEAIESAIKLVHETGDLPVPLNIRNAPTSLMKEIGYGKDYKYAHDYEDNFVEEEFLPEKIKGTILYMPQDNQREKEIKERLIKWWKNKYKY